MPDKYVLNWVPVSTIISIKLFCFPTLFTKTSVALSFHLFVFFFIAKTKNETVTSNPVAFFLIES